MSTKAAEEFEEIVKEFSENPKSYQMRDFIQHGQVTTYDHCMAVSKMSYSIGRHFKVNRRSLVKGAFLHDYFLYDWHKMVGTHHGKMHPLRAAENAERDFGLTKKEREIIKCHMWPLTLTRVPKSREAIIVCVADKIVSLKETMVGMQQKATAVFVKANA